MGTSSCFLSENVHYLYIRVDSVAFILTMAVLL